MPVDIDKQQLAIKHYKNKELSLGKCAELAEMTKGEFIKLLGKNEISIFRFNSEDELLEDVKNV